MWCVEWVLLAPLVSPGKYNKSICIHVQVSIVLCPRYTKKYLIFKLKSLYLSVNLFNAEPTNWGHSPDRIGKLFFEERGKPEYAEKNLAEQERKTITNSTHICAESGN